MHDKGNLGQICEDFGLLALYLFGSRADDGLRLLRGEEVSGEGSDLDVGIVFRSLPQDLSVLSRLQVELEEIFEPLRVDVVPLHQVDALFQYSTIEGHRVAATDEDEADRYELIVMNMATELLFIQRQLEVELSSGHDMKRR